MVLQEELQLALFKAPSGENLFLDRVSVYFVLLSKFLIYHIKHKVLNFYPDYSEIFSITCCFQRFITSN